MSSDDPQRAGSTLAPAATTALIEQAVAKHRRRTGAEPAQASAKPPERLPGSAGPTRPGSAPTGPAPTGLAPPRPAPTDIGPGGFGLVCGVIYPATVIVIEAATRVCAQHLFDPMPTWGHVALLAMVPLANLIVWAALTWGGPQSRTTLHPRFAAGLTGIAVAVSGFYALVFLPLMPLALVGILIGIGLLPLAPVASLWASIAIAGHLRQRHPAGLRFAAPFAGGIGLVVLAILAMDVPHAVTRHGVGLAMSHDAAEREHGIMLLRTVGSTDLLLRMGQGHASRPAGPITFVMDWDEMLIGRAPRRRQVPHLAAREVYYRVTGEPFTMQAGTLQPGAGASAEAARAIGAFDRDLGGSAVGATVPGLSLSSSRIDGTIAADDLVAYLEWVFEVRNDTEAMQEARMTLALPPGAVVSRVTLWVNGVEEEAAFAGRAQVRAAYERVVRRAQDPFLVTTSGADRVLAQAFPVPPRGGIMKFKVGITAPLEIEGTGAAGARLVLPAISDRNFGFDSAFRHAVWLESKRPLTAGSAGLTATALGSGTRIVGEVGDATLARARPVILAERDAARRIVYAANPETGEAVQEILAPSTGVRAETLMLVVDGSARTRSHVKPILEALDALPTGQRVGLVLAGETVEIVAAAPWSPAMKARIAAALEAGTYVGGIDNTDALIAALTTAGNGPRAHVLWVHGPQPVRFTTTKARLEQAAARITRAPALSFYALTGGPNQLLIDAPWTVEARDIPNTGDVTADLARGVRRITGVEAVPVVRRTLIAGQGLTNEPHMPEPTAALPKGSDHIVRLAARDELLALLRAGKPAQRQAATELAGLHRLVTPVSGAVVLETKRQYAEAGLTQGHKGQAGSLAGPSAAHPQPGNVPTVPEPHEWALILMAAAALGWLLWSRRGEGARRFAVAGRIAGVA